MNAARTPSRRNRRREPLEVRLSVQVNFGEDEEDRILVIDDRRIWMVGSVFQYRDRIAKLAVATVIRAALLQPKIAAKVMPGLTLMAARASRRAKN